MSIKSLQLPTLLINHLIDKGAKEEISLVEEKRLKRTLFKYLGEKYDIPDLSDFAKKPETEDILRNGLTLTMVVITDVRKFNVLRITD